MGFFAEAFAASLLLLPFGSVETLTLNQNPWHGFKADGAKLLVARAEKIADQPCARWLQALSEDSATAEAVSFSGDGPEWDTWTPWNPEDLKAVEDCDSFPCAVKLNRPETEAMQTAGKRGKKFRLPQFLSLVTKRGVQYLAHQTRNEFEFPGAPVDPWDYFEKAGFKSEIKKPEKISLWLRTLDFAPGKIRAIRQVLDRRVKTAENRGTVWLRDVYTDHYFDSWGEWANVRCEKGGVVLTQAYFAELDLLKKTDLFSRLAHGKMRGAIEENGEKYLDQWALRLKKQVSAPH